VIREGSPEISLDRSRNVCVHFPACVWTTRRDITDCSFRHCIPTMLVYRANISSMSLQFDICLSVAILSMLERSVSQYILVNAPINARISPTKT